MSKRHQVSTLIDLISSDNKSSFRSINYKILRPVRELPSVTQVKQEKHVEPEIWFSCDNHEMKKIEKKSEDKYDSYNSDDSISNSNRDTHEDHMTDYLFVLPEKMNSC